MSATPPDPRRAPLLGEHTRDADRMSGFSDDEIAAELRAASGADHVFS